MVMLVSIMNRLHHYNFYQYTFSFVLDQKKMMIYSFTLLYCYLNSFVIALQHGCYMFSCLLFQVLNLVGFLNVKKRYFFIQVNLVIIAMIIIAFIITNFQYDYQFSIKTIISVSFKVFRVAKYFSLIHFLFITKNHHHCKWRMVKKYFCFISCQVQEWFTVNFNKLFRQINFYCCCCYHCLLEYFIQNSCMQNWEVFDFHKQGFDLIGLKMFVSQIFADAFIIINQGDFIFAIINVSKYTAVGFRGNNLISFVEINKSYLFVINVFKSLQLLTDFTRNQINFIQFGIIVIRGVHQFRRKVRKNFKQLCILDLGSVNFGWVQVKGTQKTMTRFRVGCYSKAIIKNQMNHLTGKNKIITIINVDVIIVIIIVVAVNDNLIVVVVVVKINAVNKYFVFLRQIVIRVILITNIKLLKEKLLSYFFKIGVFDFQLGTFMCTQSDYYYYCFNYFFRIFEYLRHVKQAEEEEQKVGILHLSVVVYIKEYYLHSYFIYKESLQNNLDLSKDFYCLALGFGFGLVDKYRFYCLPKEADEDFSCFINYFC
ncbi:transmembrane protein, putative (macronuclear) [Tetrahymena thermophila SB210]|uniref:Transmembrane protein, putative n=1 Tax=Tetrahymena thermophila (strain SB210) TaxID=312017 RepID=W7X678_TETTS|nr:transmembrane protein, putative [Tetrahymena thermophila SB210]EWS71828.1 transmembrane protein, putative [Tetrahymena thermophila SB210]|eukprot:XP_012655650.1 transmembrane protein, putative [Tetrahymena thermophila SB210]